MQKYLVSTILGVTALSACNGGGGGDSYVRPATRAETFVKNINYEDGTATSYTLAKDPTLQGSGFIVVSDSSSLSGYRAINIDSGWRGTYVDDLDFYNNDSVSVWPDGASYYRDAWGTLYESSAGTPRDLEKAGAFVEKIRVQNVGEQLSANYGLSEDRGLQVAKLVVDWKKLKKRRQITDTDANAFSEKMFGFNINQAESSVKKYMGGEKEDLNKLLEKAARVNQTSPEHMREIFEEILAQ